MRNLLILIKSIFILVVIWLLLTAGNLASWVIGIPFIALAIRLQPKALTKDSKKSPFINVVGLVQFFYFFIVESLRGGVDVSRRVLGKKLQINPVFYDYSMQLELPQAQQLFISSISLLPGTLCSNQEKNQLLIHTLDQSTDTTQGIKKLERTIGKIFGEAF